MYYINTFQFENIQDNDIELCAQNLDTVISYIEILYMIK